MDEVCIGDLDAFADFGGAAGNENEPFFHLAARGYAVSCRLVDHDITFADGVRSVAERLAVDTHHGDGPAGVHREGHGPQPEGLL